MIVKILFCLLVSSAVALTVPVLAFADKTNPDEISRMLGNGEILSLAKILEIVRPVTGTRILEVEMEHEDFGLIYEIYFLDPQGRRREIYVDARNGNILSQELDD